MSEILVVRCRYARDEIEVKEYVRSRLLHLDYGLSVVPLIGRVAVVFDTSQGLAQFRLWCELSGYNVKSAGPETTQLVELKRQGCIEKRRAELNLRGFEL